MVLSKTLLLSFHSHGLTSPAVILEPSPTPFLERMAGLCFKCGQEDQSSCFYVTPLQNPAFLGNISSFMALPF